MRFSSWTAFLGALCVVTADAPMQARAAPASPTPASPAAAILDHDDHMAVNSLDMIVSNHGSIAYDLVTGNGGLAYPRGTLQTVVFAAGPWVAARVNGGIRVATGEYGQEFVPGPMQNGTFVPDQAAFHNFVFDRSHPLSTSDRADYLAQGGPTDSTGNPLLQGDATIWSVFNDADPAAHTNQSGRTPTLGVEIRQTVYAYRRTGPIGRVIYVAWELANKGPNRLDSTYVSLWCDPDLGGSQDDLVGCDTTLALGYCYNATNADMVYGSTPPAVGLVLLRGPVAESSPGVADTLGMTSFTKYIGGTDPQDSAETYHLMRGLHPDGTPVHEFDVPSYPITPFAVSGLDPASPSTPANWLDAIPTDRRFIVSSGPFTMLPGDSTTVLFAICVAQGSDRLGSISDLKDLARLARTYEPPSTAPLPIGRGRLDVAIAPNPLRTTGILVFTTTRAGYARVRLFDVHGRLVRTLLDESALPTGAHAIPLEARYGPGHGALGSGVHWLRIETAEATVERRITIVK